MLGDLSPELSEEIPIQMLNSGDHPPIQLRPMASSIELLEQDTSMSLVDKKKSDDVSQEDPLKKKQSILLELMKTKK